MLTSISNTFTVTTPGGETVTAGRVLLKPLPRTRVTVHILNILNSKNNVVTLHQMSKKLAVAVGEVNKEPVKIRALKII